MADTPYGASGATEQQEFTARQERAITGIKERFAQLPVDERLPVLNEVTTWLKATPPGQEAMHAEG
jgi:hypothetical protein